MILFKRIGVVLFLIFHFIIYLFLVVLCFVVTHRALSIWVSSGCGEQGLVSPWGTQASHCCGFSGSRAWAQKHADFSSCGSRALEHGFMAHRLCPMHMGSSWTRNQTCVPCIDRFLTTGPQGKSLELFLMQLVYCINSIPKDLDPWESYHLLCCCCSCCSVAQLCPTL